MVKIFIEKNEEVASVIERIVQEQDEEIILVVPRNSKLKESIENFSLIQREASAAKKTVHIESVDEEVLAFGRMHKMEGAHPLFSGKTKSLSDIVLASGDGALRKTRSSKGKKVSLKVNVPREEDERREEAEEHFFESQAEYPDEAEEEEQEGSARPPRRRKALLVGGLAVLILAAGVWGWSVFGARAQVTINFKQVPWEMEGVFTADKSASQANASSRIVPGELFEDKKNITQLFPASGRATVSQKATGQITIYNAYSSAKQTLVATTRFMTPDGKVFRLDREVTVPGAGVKNGQITPASIKASVTADKAGPDYNVGPVAKLTVPGFKGSPKYDGFYGAMETAASGGFVGEKAVPTDADMAAAKDKVNKLLAGSFSNALLSGSFKDFKILDGASRVTVTKLAVKKDTDANGQFSVFGEAAYQAIGFRESDLKNVLLELANRDNPGTTFRELNLEYKDPQPNYDKGRVAMTVSARGSLATAFQPDEMRSKIAGQKLDQVRSMIAQLAGLSDAKVSLWPLWLGNLPGNQSRIEVVSN